MNDSRTPKIVVGVVLVAAYAGIAAYMLRDKSDGNVVLSAAADTAGQTAGAIIPTPAIASPVTDLPASTDESTSVAEPPATEIEAPSTPVRATANSIAPAAPAPRAQPELKAQAREQPIAREQTIAAAAEIEDPGPASEIASAGDDAATLAADAASPGPAGVASSDNDSQITAEVKTQIAAVAPTSTIDVATTDGVVELSGSVPTHEEINKVLMAARSVEHVRSVDASAVVVNN
jgi:hyperosmotically inducible periplasmic protein